MHARCCELLASALPAAAARGADPADWSVKHIHMAVTFCAMSRMSAGLRIF